MERRGWTDWSTLIFALNLTRLSRPVRRWFCLVRHMGLRARVRKAIQSKIMAGFVPSPNTIRVLWHITTHGRPQLYVTHAEYSLAGPLNPNIGETIWSTFKTSFGTAELPQWATTFSMDGVEVIDIRGPNNPGVPSTSASVVGTGAAVGLPDQVSIVVTLRTNLTGRSFRGRVYTIGYTTTAVDATGSITTGARDAALTVVNAMKAGIAASGGTFAIRSPAKPDRPSKPGGTLPATVYAITPVSTFEVRDLIFDTNRRRVDLLRR